MSLTNNSGEFSIPEKVQYALKTAIMKTMTAPNKNIYSELAAPPRIFPTNIRRTPLIEINKGDITSEQKYHDNHNGSGTAGTLVDMNNPWSVLSFYKVIDPTTNRVSNRTVSQFVGFTSIYSKTTLSAMINNGNPASVADFNINKAYKDWYYEGFYHSQDSSSYQEGHIKEFGGGGTGSGAPLLDLTGDDIYKGVALAYNHTPSGTTVTTTENSQFLVPHLRLYIKVKTNILIPGEQPGDDPAGDCLAFWNPLFRDSLGLESGCDIGIINGRAFSSSSLPNASYPSVITSGTGEWFSQSTAGVIAFYAADTDIQNKFVRESTVSGTDAQGNNFSQYDNYPYLSFLKYTGNSGINMEIKYGTTQPTESNANDQLFINTAENTLHRYDAPNKVWTDIGGTGEQITSNNNSVITDSSGVSIDISGVNALSVDLSGNVSVINTPDTINNNHVVNYGFLNTKISEIDTRIDNATSGSALSQFLTEQPRKFAPGNFTPNQSKITFNWTDGVSENERIKLSILDGISIPIIDYIRIFVREHETTTWQPVRNNSNSVEWPPDTNGVVFNLGSTINGTDITLTNDKKIVLKVYGVNSCKDSETDLRALILDNNGNGNGFLLASKPSTPAYTSVSGMTVYDMTTTWQVSQIDSNIASNIEVPLHLASYKLTYTPLETYRLTGNFEESGYDTIASGYREADFDDPVTWISGGVTFEINTDNALYPGTKYRFSCEVKNNSSTEYSDPSGHQSNSTTEFTTFPAPAGYNPSYVNFNVTQSQTTFYTNSGNVTGYYCNKDTGSDKNILTWQNGSKEFEITDTDSSIANSHIGKRPGTANIANIVVNKKEASSATSVSSTTSFSMIDASGVNSFLTNQGVKEHYSNSSKNYGFRKNAICELRNITTADFSPNSAKHEITYQINTIHGSTQEVKEQGFDIYVDNLTDEPVTTLNAAASNDSYFPTDAKEYSYCCGIRSLKKFKIHHPNNATMTNMRSTYGFFPNNNVCEIYYNSVNSKIAGLSTSQYFQHTGGVFSDSFTPLEQANLRFSSSNTGGSLDSYTINVKARGKNMKGWGDYSTPNQITIQEHYDPDSFNFYNNYITTTNCPSFLELDSATIGAANDIIFNSYTTHQNPLSKNHTPVFYEGRFRANDASPSPYINHNGSADYSSFTAGKKIIAFEIPAESSGGYSESYVTDFYNNKRPKNSNGNVLASYQAFIYIQLTDDDSKKLGVIHNGSDTVNFISTAAWNLQPSSTSWDNSQTGANFGAWHTTQNVIVLPFGSSGQQSTIKNVRLIITFDSGYI